MTSSRSYRNGRHIDEARAAERPTAPPKGARAALADAFLRHLLDDFEKNGVATIEQFRAEKPSDYVKIVASFLSKDVTGMSGPTDPITEVRYTIVDP